MFPVQLTYRNVFATMFRVQFVLRVHAHSHEILVTQLTPIALLGPLITGYTSHQYSEHERLLVVSILCLMSLIITVWVNSAMNHLADKKRRCSEIL